MAWNDRVREAAYTAPISKVRTVFDFENVRHSFDRRGKRFSFPLANGTYVQETGNSGRKFPIRAFFSGDDYDLQAANFMAALSEKGIGILEHPAYGKVDVVPFGAITQRDDLVTRAGQAVVEVTFWETTGIIFPAPSEDKRAVVLDTIVSHTESSAKQFESDVALNTSSEVASFQAGFGAAQSGFVQGMDAIAAANGEIKTAFDTVDKSISNSIDNYVQDPLTLAFQTSVLIKTPALVLSKSSSSLRALSALGTSISFSPSIRQTHESEEVLGAYSDQISSFTSDVRTAGADTNEVNRFFIDSLFATNCVIGQLVAAVNSNFNSRGDALAVAESLLSTADSVAQWQDENRAALGLIDTGEGYREYIDAVSQCVGYLVDISFDLRQEQAKILDRPRSVVDLVSELYGDVDSNLDFFIESNELTGDQIIGLQQGERVVYYQ